MLNSRKRTYVRVHSLDLLPGGCSKDLDNLDQLIDTRFTREEGLSQHQFSHHTSCRPNICESALDSSFGFVKPTNGGCVVGSAKDQFGSSVVSRTDIADVWFTGNEDFG